MTKVLQAKDNEAVRSALALALKKADFNKPFNEKLLIEKIESLASA